MIAIVVLLAALLFLLCLTFGIRSRQPRAIVAAFLILATLYCLFGFLTAGLLADGRLIANLYLAAAAFCLILAGFLAFTAWRHSSDSP